MVRPPDLQVACPAYGGMGGELHKEISEKAQKSLIESEKGFFQSSHKGRREEAE